VVVHLGAGKERDGWQVALQQAHILDDQRVRSALVDLPDQAQRFGNFRLVQQGIDHHIDLCPIFMGVADQAFHICQRIPGRLARAKAGCANIDRVCTAVDGGQAGFQVFGRGEQFKRHERIVIQM
jgi:hypothetical protein